MRCEDFMTTPPEILSPEESAVEAARLMRDLEVGFLPVCEPDRTVLGTLSDRDLVTRVIADERAFDTPVSEVMSGATVACRPDDDIRHAATLMRETEQGRILVIDDAGRLVGIISLLDLARYDMETRSGRPTFSDVVRR